MKLLSRTFFWIVALLNITAVYCAYMYFFRWNWFFYFMSDTPRRPFVYRVLPILIIKAFSTFLPISMVTCAYIIIFIAFIGFVISLHSMASMYWDNLQSGFITVLSMFALLPLMFENEYIYDIPNLFLFTLAMAAIQREKWKLFLVAFTLASLNKETSILLTLVFAAIYWEKRDKTFWNLVVAQLSIYLVIRAVLMFVFRNYPGAVMDTNITRHIKVIWENQTGVLIALTFLGLILFGISKGLKQAPFFLRRGIIIFPVLYILYLVGGAPFEIRVFYEAFSVVFLVCVCAIIKPAVISTGRVVAD